MRDPRRDPQPGDVLRLNPARISLTHPRVVRVHAVTPGSRRTASVEWYDTESDAPWRYAGCDVSLPQWRSMTRGAEVLAQGEDPPAPARERPMGFLHALAAQLEAEREEAPPLLPAPPPLGASDPPEPEPHPDDAATVKREPRVRTIGTRRVGLLLALAGVLGGEGR